MDLEEAIQSRRSVRSFTSDPVERETIEELLALAGQAPSSFNAQPWRFHVVTGDAREPVKSVLAQTTRFVSEYLESLTPDQAEVAEDFFAELGHAPVLIGVSAAIPDDEAALTNVLLGVGGAIQNLQLAAWARGLAACCITFSYWVRDELAEVLDVPPNRRIVSMLLLGVPAHRPAATPRNDSIVTFIERDS